MVKDFIAIKDFDCPWCSRIEVATVLAESDIDLIFASSGDPRVENLGEQVDISYESLPVGIVDGKLINYSRDILFMTVLFDNTD